MRRTYTHKPRTIQLVLNFIELENYLLKLRDTESSESRLSLT